MSIVAQHEEEEQVPLIEARPHDDGRQRDDADDASISDVVISADESAALKKLWSHPLTRSTLLAIFFLGILPTFFNDTKTSPQRNVDGTTKTSPDTNGVVDGAGGVPQWAQYSPYYAAEVYVSPQEGCVVDQVNILQRHGARFPTTHAAERIQSAIKKLKSVEAYTDPKIQFLKKYEYDLGQEELVPLGIAESVKAGEDAFTRYKGILNVVEDGVKSVPFVRASGSPRVVDSATNWTKGFQLASHGQLSPRVDVVVDENLNNTLHNNFCPNAEDGSTQTTVWRSRYAPPITSRLHAAAPGANLSDEDIPSLMSLCAFESVAKGRKSPFCGLFGDFEGKEWNEWEYEQDVSKYYGTGYGNDLGPVQGVGYVNELLARLTNLPVHDHTQTNRTLDSNPVTFPLNRTLYADFSHDNAMVAIYSAIGLLRQRQPLDPSNLTPNRTWILSRMVPFAGRLVTERLNCGGDAFVRMLVDDGLQDLEFCGARGDGMCALDQFVKSQAFARNDGDGDWERCSS